MECEVINALQAYEMSTERNEQLVQQQKELIFKQIHKAIQDGKLETFIDVDKVYQSNIDLLKKLGYGVTQQFEEKTIRVSWIHAGL